MDQKPFMVSTPGKHKVKVPLELLNGLARAMHDAEVRRVMGDLHPDNPSLAEAYSQCADFWDGDSKARRLWIMRAGETIEAMFDLGMLPNWPFNECLSAQSEDADGTVSRTA